MSACPRCDTERPESVKYCPNCGLPVQDEQTHEDPLVGAHFDGRYEVLSKVASGGFGTVYRVKNLDLNTIEALKVLHPHVASLPKQIRRFRQDAQLLRQLSRETSHVPELHHFAQDGERRLWYFTLEFLDGISLHQVLLQEEPLELARIVDILRQICTALTVAHQHDPPVVHRDLKPDNIFLLDRDGRDFVKVLDFGIAKRVGHDSLTDVGQGLGSWGYMPPEQYLGEDVDGRTDLFAVGVLGYNMLTGRDPWLGGTFGTPSSRETQMRIMDSMMNRAPVPIPEARQDVPREIDAIIMRLLEKEPANRFQSAVELDKALERTQLTVGVPSGGNLRVDSVPSGAAVLLRRDAAVVAKGVTPWEIGPLPSGDYDVRIRAKRCQPARVGVRIVENETSHVEVPLERIATPSERALASLARAGEAIQLGAGQASGATFRGLGRGLALVPWRWLAIGVTVLAVGGGGAYALVQVLKGPEVVTDGQLLARLERQEISEIRVRRGGDIEAVTNPDGETVRVSLASLKFQALLRLVQETGVPILSAGGRPATVSIVGESDTGAEPERGVLLKGESDQCGPCSAGHELQAGWYEVQTDSAWIVDEVEVRQSSTDLSEPLTRPYFVYLAGGLSTEIRLRMTRTLGRQLSEYLTAADRAIGMQDYQAAVGQLEQVLEMEPSNARADSIFARIGEDLAAKARSELQAGRLNQALSSASACVRLLTRHYDACGAVSEEAARRIRENVGPIVPPPPPDTTAPLPPPPPPPPPPPGPSADERYTRFLVGSWRLVESWEGVRCNSGSDPSERITITEEAGGGFRARGTRVEICNTQRGATLEIDLIGIVTTTQIRLEGSRGDDSCTYVAERDQSTQSGIRGGTFVCESKRTGSWRLDTKGGS